MSNEMFNEKAVHKIWQIIASIANNVERQMKASFSEFKKDQDPDKQKLKKLRSAEKKIQKVKTLNLVKITTELQLLQNKVNNLKVI